MKILHVFDFDGTLLNTPLPEHGKSMYESIYGKVYPHKGWWSKRESLDKNFEINPIEPVYNIYKQAYTDGNSITSIVTNRMRVLEDLVLYHLERHQIICEYYNYADSIPGRNSKPTRVKKLLGLLDNVSEIRIYEDMEDQIIAYQNEMSELKSMGLVIKIFRITRDHQIEAV